FRRGLRTLIIRHDRSPMCCLVEVYSRRRRYCARIWIPMENILARLTERQIVVDLGCGPGSFHYESYMCHIIGIDLNVSQRGHRSHVTFLKASSAEIPLASNSVDVVVCHHTLEHFDDFRATLGEVNRILKDDGIIWIAIPN